MKIKVSRNNPCPCLSGLKYKHCCEGNINWENILSKKDDSHTKYLSPRGKNLIFIENIADILELNNTEEVSNENFKNAFTPARVRKIYEMIPAL